MVTAVNSSLPGISGLGAASSGARAPRSAPINAATDATIGSAGVGLGSNTLQDQGATTFSNAAAAAYQAQAFGQQSAMTALPSSDLAARARRAAAAYQATTDQTNGAKLASDVHVPGLPPRLASGRMLDLSA